MKSWSLWCRNDKGSVPEEKGVEGLGFQGLGFPSFLQARRRDDDISIAGPLNPKPEALNRRS